VSGPLRVETIDPDRYYKVYGGHLKRLEGAARALQSNVHTRLSDEQIAGLANYLSTFFLKCVEGPIKED